MPKLLGLLFLLGCISLTAQQQRRIYIAPDDHTDYMWTGDEATYRQSFVKMLDYYLDLSDKTRNEPSDFQSRWHADGSFWLWTYEHDKTPAEFARLISRIKDGHISFPLNALVSTYGGTPTEAVLRGMYYSGALERRFGLKIPMAIAMEDQTMPYGLGALWAGSGAKYSWKGTCGCATKVSMYGKRPHDIYWWKADDGSRILMKWNALTPKRLLMGNYLEARDLPKAITHVETDPDFRSAYPYDVIGIFGKGGDDLETLTEEFVKVAKEKSTPERRVIVSDMNDFFVDFEKTYGQRLPEFSASFGNEWDLYTASISEISARVRRSVEKLRSAEALASLVALQTPAFLNGRQQVRDEAWMSLGVFWEHDWTADGPVSRHDRTEWGREIAAKVERYVDGLYSDAAYSLGGLIGSSSAGKTFYVFNALGWKRSSVADIRWNENRPVHVVDLDTGMEVPSQTVTTLDGDGKTTRRYLRILASGLPPVGYKVFQVIDGKGREYPPAASFMDGVLESERYRLKVEGNGAIRSLIDKAQKNREFGGRAMNDLGPDQGTLEVENSGPVSLTVKATAEGPLAHTTRITLIRDSRQIEIRNDINQNFDGTHAWSFKFNLQAPDVWHEESGVVIRAKTLADGGHYSPDMSRLEWLTLNHFVDMSGTGGTGVTLSSSDLSFMKLGESSTVNGVSNLDVKTPQISVLAGGQIDGPSLGIYKQGGDSHFLQRFALRTHTGFTAPEAMKFSLEHQNPPVTGWVRGGGTYPQHSYSFLTVNNPNVLLWALKPADDGMNKGLIARFWNLASSAQDYSVTLAPGISTASRATHIETDIALLKLNSGKISARAERSQIQTLRLVPVTPAPSEAKL